MDRCECWKSIEIGQSAAKFRIGKRSETSLKRRTSKRGKRETYGFIYLLIDPVTTEVRYVGKTSRNIFVRLAEHFRLRDKTANKNLQKWLSEIECEPILKFRKYPTYLLQKAEAYWIKYYSLDNRLYNFQIYNPKHYLTPTKVGQFRKILRISPNTGEVKEYINMTEASIKNNVYIGNISKCASGERRTTGGFIWRYSPVSTER